MYPELSKFRLAVNSRYAKIVEDTREGYDFAAWQPTAPGLKRAPGKRTQTARLLFSRSSKGEPKMRIIS